MKATYSCLLIALLAATPLQLVSAATDDLLLSGFLADYASLQPAANDPDTLIAIDSDTVFSAYDKVMVDEILFWYADDSPYKGISPHDFARIGQSAFGSLQKALAGRFEIVDAPGPGVLHVRAAITGIRATKKGKTLLSYTPAGLIKEGIESAVGANIVLRDATAEVEILDSVTGRRLVAAVDVYAGFPQDHKSAKASWRYVDETFNRWAQFLRSHAAVVSVPHSQF